MYCQKKKNYMTGVNFDFEVAKNPKLHTVNILPQNASLDLIWRSMENHNLAD